MLKLYNFEIFVQNFYQLLKITFLDILKTYFCNYCLIASKIVTFLKLIQSYDDFENTFDIKSFVVKSSV
jgi:hypothetical protein